MKRGDIITIEGYKGRQIVTIVGFQSGTGEMLIDDGSDDFDQTRFCPDDEVVEANQSPERH
jgi:hypothetical protein